MPKTRTPRRGIPDERVIAAWVVMTIVTPLTRPKPESELPGLVYGLPDPNGPDVAAASQVHAWWESPKVLGFTALAITFVLSLFFV